MCTVYLKFDRLGVTCQSYIGFSCCIARIDILAKLLPSSIVLEFVRNIIFLVCFYLINTEEI